VTQSDINSDKTGKRVRKWAKYNVLNINLNSKLSEKVSAVFCVNFAASKKTY